MTGISAAHAQNGKDLFVQDRSPYRGLKAAGSGFLIENPEMMVGPGVTRVSISPDGRFVLAVRYRPTNSVATIEAKLAGTESAGYQDEISLTIRDGRDGRTTVIWRYLPPAETSVSVQTRSWFAASTKAIVCVDTRSTDENGKPVAVVSYFIVDAATRSLQETSALDYDSISARASPTQPFASLLNAEGSATDEMRFLGADGAVTPPIKIPGFMWFTRWSPDGTEMRGYHAVEKPDHTSTAEWYAINPATQSIRPIPEPPKNSKGETDYGDDDADPTNPPFHLVAQPNPPSLAPAARSTSVWLEANDGTEKILLTSDGAPLTYDGVPVGVTRFGALYSMAGALYVVPIREIGAKGLARLRQGNVRKETMAKAQTISSALVTFTFSHARLFPDAGGDLAKSLKLPADSALLKDFTYQPQVLQKFTRRDDPQTALPGFVAAPGGRANIYSDGQVKWEDAVR